MDGVINKGIGSVLVVIFLAIALLVLGNLGSGPGSFWYGINNPNTTGATGAVSTMQTTVLPIIAVVAVFLALIFAALSMSKGK